MNSISVLLPAFNAARFLPQAIESVLAQTHRDFELLMIDDGSTDNTLEIARSFAATDSRVRVISHENFGLARALNEAMPLARGEWIARLDADDIMEPFRLSRQLEFLQANPDLAIASSLVRYIDESGKIIGKSSSHFTSRAEIARYQQNHWPIGFHHPAAIFRKATILALGGYRPEFSPAEDMDLWNRAVDAGHVVLVQEEYLTQYRIHAASTTVARFRFSEEKARWIEACIRARHHNLSEPSWEQFQHQRKDLPWARRINARRCENARALYKSAVLHFSRRRYQRFIPLLLTAMLLEPWYVLQRLLPQFRAAR